MKNNKAGGWFKCSKCEGRTFNSNLTCDNCASGREPLVQEVIRLHKAYAKGKDVPNAILDAVKKLAEWKS